MSRLIYKQQPVGHACLRSLKLVLICEFQCTQHRHVCMMHRYVWADVESAGTRRCDYHSTGGLRYVMWCSASEWDCHSGWKHAHWSVIWLHTTTTSTTFITSTKEVMFLPDFVCLSVCLSVSQQDNSKSYGRIFLKFWGYVRNSTNYQWFNFGGDPEGILDYGSLWNFRYHCFQ